MPHPPTIAAPDLPSVSPATAKRRGNPKIALAPRCGARTRAGCPCRAPAIRGKQRCRMHGGRSTGPRTEAGMARLRVARTVHGDYGGTARARKRYVLTSVRRMAVLCAAILCREHLPAAFVGRMARTPPELVLPAPCPAGLTLTPAQDRAVLRAEAEALAPWRWAIAVARAAKRAARGVGKAHAPVRASASGETAVPPASAVLAETCGEAHAPVRAAALGETVRATAGALLAKTRAEGHAPVRGHEPLSPTLSHRGRGRSAEAHAPVADVEASAVLAAMRAQAPAPERVQDQPARDRDVTGMAEPRAPVPDAWGDAARATSLAVLAHTYAEAHAPVRGHEPLSPTLSHRGRGSNGKAHAPVWSSASGETAVAAASAVLTETRAEAHAPVRAAGNPVLPATSHAEAHAPERGATGPVGFSPALGNRAARRKLKSLQRRLHRTPGA
jgi:hypothetical protein